MHLEVESTKGIHRLAISPAQAQLRLTELLRQRHLPLNTRCGQRGLCEGCTVDLLGGRVIEVATGQSLEGHGQMRSIRACEYRPAEGAPVRIRIPPRSLLAYEPQVVSDFKIRVPRAQDPLWQVVEIPAAELHDGRDPAEQLGHAVARRCKRRRPVQIDPRLPAGWDADLRGAAGCFVTTEYREDHWLVTGIARAAAPPALGAAIDIGTTTVAVLVVDLATGRTVGQAANFNRQIHLGDDVLTRINLCLTDRSQTAHLQDLVVHGTIEPLLAEALRGAGGGADRLRCVTVAGNTTMLHLFAGVDPSSMGVAPFTPGFLGHRILSATDLPLSAEAGAGRSALRDSGATIHLLPGAAAYIGADLTAGALATGLVYDDGPSLLVDVGTNGEIILKKGDHLYGCATAAGPAFEGAGLTHGVRATEGAIAHLELAGDPLAVTTEVIGHHPPIGLCGTAYIDFLAQGRRTGLLTDTGRFRRADVSDPEGRLISWKDYGLALRVAYGPGKTELVVTETDVARLLQAKAAVAAGILTLLERVGLTPAEIRTVYLAGGFGLHLNAGHAIACGLLPGFQPGQIEVVGNTSLAGAYLALLDCGALDEIARAGTKMEVIELNLDPGFESRYIDQLSLPEPATGPGRGVGISGLDPS